MREPGLGTPPAAPSLAAGRLPVPQAERAEVVIVGTAGGTHVGGSLLRAANRLGCRATLLDVERAYRGPALLRALVWRLGGHRPLGLNRFANHVVSEVSAQPMPGQVVVTTGAAPVTGQALRQLKAAGVRCLNFSTDDPWNKTQRAGWYLAALPEYDVVFTPRRSNMQDFRDLGCQDVRYLPFGYDEELFPPARPEPSTPAHDVLFVGGADPDRVTFMTGFMQSGPIPALVGRYWSRSQLSA